MALIKEPMINAQLDKMNHILGSMVRQKMGDTVDLEEIGKMVRRGLASELFDIGDQIIVPWKDTAANVEYSVPLDIVHFGNVTLESGEEVPGMYLQWHYCTPFGVQFDQNEAFWYCTEALAAGTYYFTCGNSWGNNIVSGKSYQFTLTNEVPVGGQLQLGLANSEVGACPDQSPSNWRVRVYKDATTIEPTEILTLTEGTEGTDLGTWSNTTLFGINGLNNMQRSSYGYNRWAQSGIRQFLNSKADKLKWWTAQNVYDRAPNELQTKNGFMSGFSDEFLAQLKPIKITTALNTVSDSGIGTTEDTYDTFFLASKRNENLKEQLSGVEGDVWDYWVRATKGVKPNDYQDYAAPITYAVDNHNSAQTVRLRSASRGGSRITWSVSSSGGVSSGYATVSYRFAPACVIC